MGKHRHLPRGTVPDDDGAGLRFSEGTPNPILRIGVVAQTLLFGVIGIGTTFTADGPTSGAGTVLTYAVCATTIPVAWVMSRANFGMDWWSRRAPVNNWFVVYSELGVTALTATYADTLAALHGVMLLALVGAYAAHFAHPKVIWFHVAWTSTYVMTLGVVALATTDTSVVSVVLRVIVALIVINGAVLLLSAFSTAVLRSSRVHLSDAMTDPLTGVLNRRGLEARAFGDAAPTYEAVLLVDIDDFKAVNDRHGHTAGDVALRLTAMRLAVSAGRHAAVARLGGDEFVVLLPNPTPTLGALANRLRVDAHNLGDDTPITVSIGAAAPLPGGRSPREAFGQMLRAADGALYRAKLDGRNRVACADPSSAEPH